MEAEGARDVENSIDGVWVTDGERDCDGDCEAEETELGDGDTEGGGGDGETLGEMDWTGTNRIASAKMYWDEPVVDI